MLILVTCCLLWGLNQVAVKVALPHLPPLLQLALRSGLALLLVAGWMHWRGVRWRDHQHTTAAGLLAGSLFAVEFALIFIGLQHTTAARSVVFINTSPFVVAVLLAWLRPADRLSLRQILGLLIAFAALASAFREGFGSSGQGASLTGDLLALGGALMWGLTTVTIRLTSLRSAPFELTLAYQLAVALLFSLIGAAVAGEAWPSQWPTLVLASVFYQAVIVTFASYLLWFWLLQHYPATQVQSFVFLSPVFGAGLAGLLLGEPLTAGLLLALAGVAVGLTLLNRR